MKELVEVAKIVAENREDAVRIYRQLGENLARCKGTKRITVTVTKSIDVPDVRTEFDEIFNNLFGDPKLK